MVDPSTGPGYLQDEPGVSCNSRKPGSAKENGKTIHTYTHIHVGVCQRLKSQSEWLLMAKAKQQSHIGL